MKNHRALLVVATPTSRTLGGLFDVTASADRQQRHWELQLAPGAGRNHSNEGVRAASRSVKDHVMEHEPSVAGTYVLVVLFLLLLTVLAYAGIAVSA